MTICADDLCVDQGQEKNAHVELMICGRNSRRSPDLQSGGSGFTTSDAMLPVCRAGRNDPVMSLELRCFSRTHVLCFVSFPPPLLQFAALSNEVELRKQELTILADRLGQSSHSQLEAQLEETRTSLEEETKAVEEAKAAGVAAVQRSVVSDFGWRDLMLMLLAYNIVFADSYIRYVRSVYVLEVALNGFGRYIHRQLGIRGRPPRLCAKPIPSRVGCCLSSR